MMTDFEDQLRQRLHDHAEQIDPNPETWSRVQAGIRREQRFRWLHAGASAAALAALAAVAVLVVPGILSEPRIELDPGPGVAEQPEGATEAGTDGAFAPPLEMVLATSDGVATVGPGGLAHVGVLPDTPAEAVAVRPGAVLDDLEVVASGGCQLRRFQRDPAGVAVHDIATSDPQACASGPRFSPDGGHLAWIEQDDDGTPSLATVGWGPDGEERARNARFGLDLGALADAGVEGVDAGQLRVVEWVWVEDTGTAARGFLVLASRDAGSGTNRILTLEVERQADGALALPSGDRPALLEGGDARVVGYQRTAAATWTLELTSIGSVRLVRSDEGERLTTIDLPAGDPTWADLGPVWLEVAGETAVVGDGAGAAWTVTRDADGWSAVEPLAPAGSEDVAVLHAAVLGANDPTSPAEPFEPVRASEPGLEPAPSRPVEPVPDAVPADPAPAGDDAGLPAPVADRRAAILAAAHAGNLDALAALADPEEFSYSFGDSGDPAAFWRARMAEGEDVLGQLIGVLGLPSTDLPSEGGPAITAWPWVQDGTPYESLSSAELVALEGVVGPEVMEAYQATGQYLGPRVGIRADGSWIYFTSGD